MSNILNMWNEDQQKYVAVPFLTGQSQVNNTTEFYLSTSSTELVGGEWSKTYPEWTVGTYVWTRSEITYKNPTKVEYTEPFCDVALYNKLEELSNKLTSSLIKITKKEYSTTISANSYVPPYKYHGSIDVPSADIAQYGTPISVSAISAAGDPVPASFYYDSGGGLDVQLNTYTDGIVKVIIVYLKVNV